MIQISRRCRLDVRPTANLGNRQFEGVEVQLFFETTYGFPYEGRSTIRFPFDALDEVIAAMRAVRATSRFAQDGDLPGTTHTSYDDEEDGDERAVSRR
jgi:hypothetical protein